MENQERQVELVIRTKGTMVICTSTSCRYHRDPQGCSLDCIMLKGGYKPDCQMFDREEEE